MIEIPKSEDAIFNLIIVDQNNFQLNCHQLKNLEGVLYTTDYSKGIDIKGKYVNNKNDSTYSLYITKDELSKLDDGQISVNYKYVLKNGKDDTTQEDMSKITEHSIKTDIILKTR